MVHSYPGVGIEERPSGNAPVEGVAASAMAVCGFVHKGREDYLYLSTSPEQFADQAGPNMAGWLVPTTVQAFFGNGGKRVYHVRVVASDAVAAGYDIDELVTSETPAFAPIPDGCEGRVTATNHSGTPQSQFVLTLVTAPLVDSLEVNFKSIGSAVVETSVIGGNGTETAFALKPAVDTFADNVIVLNAFVAKWNLHLANDGGAYHGIADIINPMVAGAADQAAFIAAVNSFRAKINDHRGNVSAAFHLGVDVVVPPGAVPVVSYKAAVILLRDLIDYYNLHIVKNGAVVHAVADVANGASAAGIVFPYNAAAAVAADKKLEPGSVEISWGANTIYDKGDGTFIAIAGVLAAGTVNYTTGAIALTFIAAPALGVLADTSIYLVKDRTTETFYINSDDEFVDVLVGGSFPAAILDVTGTNEIDRTAKTITFKTKVSAGVVVPDGNAHAGYADLVITAEVDYTKLYWKLRCVGKGAYGNDIKCGFSGEPDSFVSVVYDSVTDDWVDVNGDPVGTNPNLGKYLKHSLSVYEATEIGGSEFEEKEKFSDLNLTDPDATGYLPDVVNDSLSGSKLIEIDAPYGSGLPAGLDAVKVTAENLQNSAGVVIVGDGVTSTYTGRIPSAYSGNGCVPQTLKLAYTDALGAAKVVYDDGYGNLTGWVNAGGANSVDYENGTFSVTLKTPLNGAANIAATYYKEPVSSELLYTLAGGTNGTGVIGSAQTVSTGLSSTRRGIYAFTTIEEPLIGPIVPDLAGNAVVDNLIIAFCENRKNFFAPVVVPSGLNAQGAKHYRKAVLGANSKYAALYAPWTKILDPVLDTVVTFPPLGHIAGAYARTDIERNVGETPAGTEKGKLLGVLDLEAKFTKEEVGDLYAAGVNCIVDWPQTGRVLWGGRSLSTTPEWRYLSATRLFQYVEMSLYLSTWWACFENNGANLRVRLYSQVYNFMKRLYSEGYFNSNATRERDAFLVVCNESNNPQNVVDAGQVIVDVYIATSKPAEFVRLRFTQITQGASV